MVNNSWRVNPSFWSIPPYVPCDSRWWSAIDNGEAAGVCVVFAAGNEGPDAQTIGFPSDQAATL